MENSIYYTFSTMAQVLAGAIALLGVFLLYAIKQIDNELKGIAEAALIEVTRLGLVSFINKKDFNLIPGIKKAMAKNDQKDLKERLERLVDIVNTDSFEWQVREKYNTKYKFKESIIKKAKGVMILTTISILVSIIILAFTTKINSQWGLIHIFVPGVILFMISLIGNVHIIIYKVFSEN